MGRWYPVRYTEAVDQRGSFRGTPQPGPFHCLGCKSYVTGTETGHCPRCGYVPPRALVVSEATPMRWALPAGLIVIAIGVALLAR